jgi:DNA repair exonuclease SbcCD ATPase subunit
LAYTYQHGASYQAIKCKFTTILGQDFLTNIKAEYKSAKQQSYDLQRSAQFLDSILNTEPPQRKDSSPPMPLPLDHLHRRSGSKDLSVKPRFSDPPNPPPQAPLPDKPFDINGGNQLLRRADTEKQKLPNGVHPTNGQVRPDANTASQIASLSEALDAAKKEFDSQSKRLREMEDLLVQERVRRQDAEAKAKRLESIQQGSISIHVPTTTATEEEEHTTPIEDEVSSEIGKKSTDGSATQKLHQRLDLLLAESQEVKAVAERWKREKEQVEQERDEERKEKLSLMEMIEKIRRDERENAEKESKKRNRKDTKNGSLRGSTTAPTSNETDKAQEPDVNGGHTSPISRGLFSNGHLSGPLMHASGKDSFAAHTGQVVQAAPYISAMSVVLIGVAVMALVNKMARGNSD